jgi:hypothetical protein
MPRIIAFMWSWHVRRSDAFHDLLIEPLSAYTDIEVREWEPNTDPPQLSEEERAVFCQWLPSTAWIRKQSKPIVWLPMWDNVYSLRQSHWTALPRNLRIVAFCSALAQRTRNAGLDTIELQYFKNPATYSPASWNQPRTLLYWNRTGFVSKTLLLKMCEVLQVERLIFRQSIDPGIPRAEEYALPNRIGEMQVDHLPITSSREKYYEKLAEANMFIAPRAYEGAGMLFLEALASGCAVFAHNAPTMNEYIAHGSTGFLFDPVSTMTPGIIIRKASRRIARIAGFLPEDRLVTRLPQTLNWQPMETLDVVALGQSARCQHEHGFIRWQESIGGYAKFVLS